jgi:Fe-S cluster biosynthesis and repair protein YggX
MTDTNARVEQFRKMAEADPENALAHFSLGKALLEAEQHAEAARSLQRAIALDPNIGKLYQLLAEAQLGTGHRDYAVETLTNGVRVAQGRGDLLPRNEMIAKLKELGAPVPEFDAPRAPQPVGEGEVHCNRCGRVNRKLPGPPFSNEQGREIYEKICADCWREWIGMGTKVINELRLPLSDPQAQKVFDQHMYEFLNLKPK